jgi:hypothetical protein
LSATVVSIRKRLILGERSDLVLAGFDLEHEVRLCSGLADGPAVEQHGHRDRAAE